MKKQYNQQFTDEDVAKIISKEDFSRLFQQYFSDSNVIDEATNKRVTLIKADALYDHLMHLVALTLTDLLPNVIPTVSEHKDFFKDMQRFLIMCIGKLYTNILLDRQLEKQLTEKIAAPEICEDCLKSVN